MIAEKVTLDTNVILEYLKNQRRAAAVQSLLEIAAAGKVDLAVTARIREDVPRSPLADRLDELADLGISEVGSVTPLGSWVLGRDVLGSEDFAQTSEAVIGEVSAEGAAPPDWRDWDHLHAHYVQERDVFLTWDGQILALAARLYGEVGLRIMSPEEYLQLHRAA